MSNDSRQSIRLSPSAKVAYDDIMGEMTDELGEVSGYDIPLICALAEAETRLMELNDQCARAPSHKGQAVNPLQKLRSQALTDYLKVRAYFDKLIQERQKQPAMQEGAQPGVRRKPARTGVPVVNAAAHGRGQATVSWLDEIRQKRDQESHHGKN